jgi:hypothetical protein
LFSAGSSRRRPALVATAVALALGGGAATAVPAQAQSSAGAFSCRASGARVTTPAIGPLVTPVLVEPFVANAAGSPCSTDDARVLTPTTVADAVTVNVVDVTTKQPPATPAAEGQGAVASASVTRPAINLPGLTIAAAVLEAEATATCRSGAPRLASSGRVVSLTVNGQTQDVPPDENVELPLGPLGSLVLNQVDTSTPGTLIRRALYLQTPVATIAIAEARVATTGTACASSGAKPGSGVLPGAVRGGGTGRARLVVTPGASASRISAGRCVNGSFRAAVQGRRITRVVFSLDGRTLKTDGRAPFNVNVPAAVGRHQLRARVTFTRASGTRARLLRLRFARCAPAPRFTG